VTPFNKHNVLCFKVDLVADQHDAREEAALLVRRLLEVLEPHVERILYALFVGHVVDTASEQASRVSTHS
jgi:hypothetical protein